MFQLHFVVIRACLVIRIVGTNHCFFFSIFPKFVFLKLLCFGFWRQNNRVHDGLIYLFEIIKRMTSPFFLRKFPRSRTRSHGYPLTVSSGPDPSKGFEKCVLPHPRVSRGGLPLTCRFLLYSDDINVAALYLRHSSVSFVKLSFEESIFQQSSKLVKF